MSTHIASLNDDDQFVFDQDNQTIIKTAGSVQLSSKAFAVLSFLYQHAQRLITKDELLNAVWPNVYVVDAVLKNTVREIRKALDDNPRTARFIQTVHGRGYRFIGKDRLLTSDAARHGFESRSAVQPNCADEHIPIGRDNEVHQLTGWWEEARKGERRAVVIAGDPGIGKTALAQAWLGKLLSGSDELLLAQARCVKTSTNPSYLPFLEALDRLCRGSHGALVTDMLSRHAPSWLSRMPWLNAPSDAGTSSSQVTDQEQLFLQTAEFLEALSHELPVLLLIEDLHWCDQLSRDLLTYLFLRDEPARLMILSTHCTWRVQPGTVFNGAVDTTHSAGRKIVLGPLSPDSIEKYVHKRFSETPCPPGLAIRLGRQSGGYPLFLKSALDELNHGGLMEQASNTHTLSKQNISIDAPYLFRQRLNIEAQMLSTRERRLLQAASIVVIPAFSAAAIAAVLDQDIVEIEEQCDELAHRGLWIRRLGSRLWPDGTLAQSFGFPHPIYRDYMYQTIPAARRCRFHLLHAKRLETAYCEDVIMIASNLAYHFERGGEFQRAEYYRQCAKNSDIAELLAKPQHLTLYRHPQPDGFPLNPVVVSPNHYGNTASILRPT